MKRRKQGTLDQLVAERAAAISAEGCDTALFGPVVLDDKGMSYFVLVTGKSDGEANVDGLYAHTRKEAQLLRGAVMRAIVNCKPIVIHDFDDELRMARMAETYWPTRFASVRHAVEQERT